MYATLTGRSSRMVRWTSSSIARSSSSVSAAVEREVEAQVVRGHERAGLAGPLPDHVAQRAMEQVRARVVAHRVGPPGGIHDRLDGLADPQPAVERAAVDDQATERLLRVGHREQLAAAARLAQDALVADLAAALGIERRPIEDDLGLAVAGQLVELHPVPDDRHDAALGGRRLVPDEPGVAASALDRAVERRLLGVARQLGLRPGAAPLALLGEGALEPIAIDGDAVLGGDLDGQVDREPVRVVEPERDVARETRRVGGELFGASPDGSGGEVDAELARSPIRAASSRRRASARIGPPRERSRRGSPRAG